MTRAIDQAFQQIHDEFDALRRKAEGRGIPFSKIHPERFEAIEKVEELKTASSKPRLAAVRVAFRIRDGGPPAFYRVEAHVLTGRIGFASFDAERRSTDVENGSITFHALYESRGDVHQAIQTGAQVIQLAAAALHLERDGRVEAAEAVRLMLLTGRGAMPGHPSAPEFDIMSEFRL